MAYSDYEAPCCTIAEERLIAATAEGREARFDGSDVIRAELIRKLMMGLPPSDTREAVSAPCGVRIKGATIRGKLDLNNGRGDHGTIMPGLLLDDCFIEDSIDISYAQLGKLSIERSRIGELQALRAVIHGELIANDITPLHADGLCYLNLHSIHVDGDVQIRRAYLREPPEPGDYGAQQYAVNLRGATIIGTLYLRETVCKGTINISLANIKGNVGARGCRIDPLKPNGVAINADDSVIDGIISLRTVENNKPFHVTGRIGLAHSRLGAATFDGAIVEWRDRQGAPKNSARGAIDLHDADIRGNLYFRENFRCRGRVDLRNVSVGDAMRASGAVFSGGLDATALRIGGDLDLSHVAADEGVCLSDAVVARMLIMHGLKADLDLSRAHVKTVEDKGECSQKWILKLDGFTYDRLETLTSETARAEIWQTRLRWLGLQGVGYKTRFGWFTRLYFVLIGRPELSVRPEDYRPQPFVQLARVLESSGFEADSRRVLRARQWIEVAAGSRRLIKPKTLFGRPWHWVQLMVRASRTILQMLFGTLFGFGFSSARALTALTIYAAVGVGGVWEARQAHMLVYDTQPETLYISRVSPPVLFTPQPDADAIECNDVDAYGYALDLMIPLVDLHVEGKCEVRHLTDEPVLYHVSPLWRWVRSGFAPALRPAWPTAPSSAQQWRLAHVVYAMLGWIIVSLSVLTLSGLLRPKERIT